MRGAELSSLLLLLAFHFTSIAAATSNETDELKTPGPREATLSIIPHVVGLMSIIGSSTIIIDIVKNKRNVMITHHRILIVLSACDIISSFAHGWSTWAVPQGQNMGWGNSYHYAAKGNDATCNAQAAGIQFGMTTAYLSVSLSISYILIIKYGVTDATIKKYFEPFLIGFPLLVGIMLTMPGFVLGIYGNSNLWCWISPNFDRCDEDNRQDCVNEAVFYRWILYYGPVWASISILVVIQVILYLFVRDLERKVARYHYSSDNSRNYRKSRRVAVQGACYSAAYIIAWLPYSVISMVNLRKFFDPHDVGGFIALLSITTFQPLQGFLNCLVYYRLFDSKKRKALCKGTFCRKSDDDFRFSFLHLSSTMFFSRALTSRKRGSDAKNENIGQAWEQAEEVIGGKEAPAEAPDSVMRAENYMSSDDEMNFSQANRDSLRNIFRGEDEV